MQKANQDIRQAAKEAGLHLWQIANALGLCDGNLSRKLRVELREEAKEHILGIIADLKTEAEREEVQS